MTNVLLADDSAFLRSVLKEKLEATGKVSVVGQAKNGKEAIDLVKLKKPDLLILDCEMPVMNGLEALRCIMKDCPLPVFMFSSLTNEGSRVTIKALEYGAVDYLVKPASDALGIDEIIHTLVRKIEGIILRNKFKLINKTAPDGNITKKKIFDLSVLPKRKIDLIALGSSTGGVQASTAFLPHLAEECPPIVWVQHMPEKFTKSFAERLDKLSKINVKEAEEGDKIKKGWCYLARGGVQMRLKSGSTGPYLSLAGEEKVSGFCPSCNVLFDSVSENFKGSILGLILTGMGDDGTKGLVKLHEKGAYVLGQDEESCVVYGMPKAANNAGAVDLELDIQNFSKAISKICNLN